MQLEELRDRYHLPEEAIELCKAAGLNTLVAIQEYEAEHGTFLELPGSSVALEGRLLDMLAAVEVQKSVEGDSGPLFEQEPALLDLPEHSDPSRKPRHWADTRYRGDPVLDQLKVMFCLSVRAYNVCENNDLFNLSSILAFSVRHGGFLKLRNCGKKTQMELIALVQEALDMGYLHSDPEQVPTIGAEGPLEKVFVVEYAKLSKEARRMLESLFGQPSARGVVAFFKRNIRQLSKLLRVEVSVLREFEVMQEALSSAMLQHAAGIVIEPPQAVPMSKLELWFRMHDVSQQAQVSLFDRVGRMTLFNFLDVHLEGVDPKAAQRICLLHLRARSSRFTMDAMGVEAGVTRERVQQVLQHAKRRIKPQLELIADLPELQQNYPELLTRDPLFIATQDRTNELNAKESTDWSPLFVSLVVELLNGPGYVHVSWGKFFGGGQETKALDYSYPVVVEKTLLPPLEAMLTKLCERVEAQRKHAIEFELMEVLVLNGPDRLHDLMSVSEQLIRLRFPEAIFKDGVCTFPPNAKWNQEDLLEDVLTHLDEPSHAMRIMEAWIERYPEQPITVAGIRSVAVRNRGRFFSIGRTSTYGLRRWEDERKDLKGGTIRDIVEELLEDSTVPLHLEDLVEEVKKFRPDTNLSSVRQNLQLEATGRFAFFPGGYLGLKSRTYESIPSPGHGVSGSLMRTTVLLRFVGMHRDELAKFLASRSKASNSRIEQVINKALGDKRIMLDEHGVILRVASAASDGNVDLSSGELAFEW